MPTGYTAIIDDLTNASFEQFVWRCARGMMPCVTMRDEPLNKLPPATGFGPSMCYKEALAEARAEVDRLESLSPTEYAIEAEMKCAAAKRRAIEANEQQAALDERYAQMKAKVEAWTPPTPEHEDLKAFMLEQLKTGRPGPSRLTPECYEPEPRHVAIKHAYETLARARHEWTKELARVEERNAWLECLRASVPMP
jgi:hypothetical protein